MKKSINDIINDLGYAKIEIAFLAIVHALTGICFYHKKMDSEKHVEHLFIKGRMGGALTVSSAILSNMFGCIDTACQDTLENLAMNDQIEYSTKTELVRIFISELDKRVKIVGREIELSLDKE